MMDEQAMSRLPAWVREIAERYAKPVSHSMQAYSMAGSAMHDMPRLIEVAAGMAEALEATIEGLWDLDGVAVPTNVGQALDRACRMAADSLAKYRGEGEQHG